MVVWKAGRKVVQWAAWKDDCLVVMMVESLVGNWVVHWVACLVVLMVALLAVQSVE